MWRTRKRLGPGKHRLSWQPDEDTEVGSYLMQLTVQDRQGQRTYGKYRPVKASLAKAPVVRVLGVEAAFDKRSYAPFEPARLTITADAEQLTLQFLACGTESEYTDRTDEMRGYPDWTGTHVRLEGQAVGAVSRSSSRSANGSAASMPPS